MALLVVLCFLLICCGAGFSRGHTDCSLRYEVVSKTARNNAIFLDPGDDVDVNCFSPYESDNDLVWTWSKSDGTSGQCSNAASCSSDVNGRAMKLSIKGASSKSVANYTCSSKKHGECSNASVAIIVPDDGVSVEPKSIVLTYNETSVSFTCSFLRSEKPNSVSWLQDNKPCSPEKCSVSDNGTLTIQKPRASDVGVYTCVLEDNSAMPRRACVHVYGKASIERHHHKQSRNMLQGDKVSIECSAFGYPAVKVSWLRDNVPLTNESGRVFLTPYEGVANATLTITDLQFEDRAEYGCRVENKHGEDVLNTTLRVKDKLAALWPFLGIVAEVVILVTIIFLYEKRRAKMEAEEAANEEASEQKKALTTPVSDKDVRQRKA